ncbi:MAG: ABC transporter permease [Candidatus Cloacimonetes bacterium]|nr:ABC transporter permease [Candidatus Cloacimonadota bacterium]MBS3767032.1 ABC transporter permease [Candidatus Cloacimonadota bacterium]
MNFQKYFLKKFFTLKGRNNFLSTNSILLISSIVIGIIALTISLGIFSGYKDVLQDIIIGVNSHIYISKYENRTITEKEYNEVTTILDSNNTYVNYSPYLNTECMCSFENSTAGIILRGLNYEQESRVSNIKQYISQGKFPVESGGIVLGKNLAERLNCSLGDTVKLISPLNSEFTMAGMIPKTMQSQVTGIFSSGMYEFDNSLAFMNYKTVRNFLDLGKVYHGIAVNLQTAKAEKAAFHSDLLQKKLEYPFFTTDWISLNKNLFSLLELEKWVISIIIALIILVSGFGMTSVLIRNIYDNQSEIGILKAMGTKNKEIRKMFLHRNLSLGIIGVVLGIILALIIGKIITISNIITIEADVYMIKEIVIKNNPIDFLFIIFVSGIIIFLSSYIPLKQIDKFNAVEIIRRAKK